MKKPDPKPTLVEFAFAVFVSIAHIVLNYVIIIPENWAGAIHFSLFGSLGALLFFRRAILRVSLVAVVFSTTAYLILNEEALYQRGQVFTYLDYVCSSAALLTGLVLVGRAIGSFIPFLVAVFFTYATMWGRHLPGVFHFPGLGWETMLFRSYFGSDGMFGNIAQLSWSSVFMFVLFGAFLQESGAGHYLIRASSRISARLSGGSGIVAVTASALMGSVSGSAIANTAATGVLTIPSMRRVGYAPEHAAAIEAAASTGGQLMPPIMGAGAFVMASFTQLPYQQIIAAALLPALLYYLSLAFYVRAYAIKQGIDMTGAEAMPPSTDRHEWRHPASLVALVVTLVAGYSPVFAVAISIICVIVLSWFSSRPMGAGAICDALARGARGMTVTALLLVVIGVLVNVVTTTGLGNTFSLMAVQWSGGQLPILLGLVALASLILGAGLPVTASYIVVATLMASVLSNLIAVNLVQQHIAAGAGGVPIETLRALLPGLSSEGGALERALQAAPVDVRQLVSSMVLSEEVLALSLLSAHMIIFWLSQDSNVTPPVCLVAYTAAGIAEASHIRTGFVAWKLAKALYVVPFLMAYSELIVGTPVERLVVFLWSVAGFFALVASIQGVLKGPIAAGWRLACLVAGAGLLWPALTPPVRAPFAVLLAGALAYDIWGRKTRKAQSRFDRS